MVLSYSIGIVLTSLSTFFGAMLVGNAVNNTGLGFGLAVLCCSVEMFLYNAVHRAIFLFKEKMG